MRNQKSKLRLAHLDFNRKFGECLNYKSGLRILILPPEVPFFGSQRWALLAKVTVFGPQKMALLVAKSKF